MRGITEMDGEYIRNVNESALSGLPVKVHSASIEIGTLL